jgi:hypothetical protein
LENDWIDVSGSLPLAEDVDGRQSGSDTDDAGESYCRNGLEMHDCDDSFVNCSGVMLVLPVRQG